MDDLRLTNDNLSEVDRLTLENDALRACVQRLAGLRADHPRVVAAVQQCRDALADVAKRRKAVKHRDDVGQACIRIRERCSVSKIVNPVIVLTLYGKDDWEAHVEGFEPPHMIGAGEGSTPLAAAKDLFVRARNYSMRCLQGAARSSSKAV